MICEHAQTPIDEKHDNENDSLNRKSIPRIICVRSVHQNNNRTSITKRRPNMYGFKAYRLPPLYHHTDRKVTEEDQDDKTKNVLVTSAQ